MKSALVVEDLPEIRSWLTSITQAAFPSIHVTATGRVQQALTLVQNQSIDLALIDLGLPDGEGVTVISKLREVPPQALSVVVTIYDDDEHLFPALQAGAFGYLLKEQPKDAFVVQLLRITQGEPPLSPSIARRVLAFFSQLQQQRMQSLRQIEEQVELTERETDVLLRVSKGFTQLEISQQLGISRHTVADYVKQIYRKLGISSRAEAALAAVRRGILTS